MSLVNSVLLALSLTVTAFSSPTYDYVIVGGGTSGLVIANRLSENPAITVAIIEAGGSVFDNPDVTSPSGYGSAFGTAIDWAFSSTAQSFAGGKKQILRAGKCIGGTSAINGMAYTRAQNTQIDNWEKIGNSGWNWSNLFPYYMKAETIEPPTASQKANGASINPAYHGTSGPLKVGFSTVGTADPLLGSTMKNLNISTVADVNGGLMHGFTVDLQTIDTTLNIREDAARAYYWPITSRTNLHMYSLTLANNIIFSSNHTGGVLATGVNITSGTTHSTISVSKEVIVSAGSLRTPVLLEHSGIGNPAILSAAGVKAVVNLPAVGENLQDQTNNGITAKNSSAIGNLASNIIYPTAADVFGSTLASVKADLLKNLTAYAATTSALSNNVTKAADILSLYKLQYDLLFDGKTPMAEILMYTNNINVQYWPLLPFSRGSIHITSSDPSVAASINPNYFALEFDIRAQTAVSQYVRKILKTSPLSSYVGVESSPGLTKVPTNANEGVWFTWVKSTYRANFHVIGSAAMKPQNAGGVVDNNLKVYGTRNIRVVDASIWPTQVCGHLMSTLYAVAERAADLIKAAQ